LGKAYTYLRVETMQNESKKEEFQRYLEKSGVIDALTKVLVGLYEAPKKPESAIDFIKEYLGASVTSDTESLKTKIEEQNKLLQSKDKEIAELTAKLAALRPTD